MTVTIDLAPETEQAIRADAQARGVAEAELLRALVERAYPRQRHLPPPGFAAHLREAREKGGDTRDGGQIVRDLRAEWRGRDERLGIGAGREK